MLLDYQTTSRHDDIIRWIVMAGLLLAAIVALGVSKPPPRPEPPTVAYCLAEHGGSFTPCRNITLYGAT